MNKTLRAIALTAAVLFAASLFLFALAVALGMAVLAVLALFTAYALDPAQTKGFVAGIRATLEGAVKAMADMVRQSGELVRELLRGLKATAPAAAGEGADKSDPSAPTHEETPKTPVPGQTDAGQ